MDIRTTAPYLESCLSHLLAAGDLAYGLLAKATYSCGTASEFRRLRCREALVTLSHRLERHEFDANPVIVGWERHTANRSGRERFEFLFRH